MKAAATVLSDAAANILFMETLEGRGHDIAVHPDCRMAVVFARRSGRFAVVIDLQDQRRARAFAPPSDRHFYGHGFFSNDGRLLFATENDFDVERGCIGIYDVTHGFTRIGEFDSGGIGPHEALLLGDKKAIAVANGGIATHPDYPRQKLNLAEMRPSITLIDIESGDLIEAPDRLYQGMNHYIGSVAVSRDGTQIATTGPRGGMAVVWDGATLRPVQLRQIADVCGVAPSRPGFLFSNGTGSIRGYEKQQHEDLAWDNHLANLIQR